MLGPQGRSLTVYNFVVAYQSKYQWFFHGRNLPYKFTSLGKYNNQHFIILNCVGKLIKYDIVYSQYFQHSCAWKLQISNSNQIATHLSW